MTDLLDASELKSWPFAEAKLLLERVKDRPADQPVIFETGYGPSGLPHLGTFQEVARTTMVMRAFEAISGRPTKLYCVSDDMDGMRKIPDNLPNKEMLQEHLQKPLTKLPDPFGTHESFGHHMNAKLRSFLDHYGFDYEFMSATDLYKSGRFDEKLLLAAERFDAIMKIMLPTLGEERQATYSPFLPISPTTGRVLYVPMKSVDAKAGTITFDDEDGTETTLPVTGGNVKLQWKPDFGMRWAALGIDYEMYGKDHSANGKIYSAICRVLGGNPPEQFVYELYLDKDGQKISKSKGNGLSIDEWLTYGPRESLAYYIFQSPKKAKRLHFDVIPRATDDYLTWLRKYQEQDEMAQKDNPVWHIHAGNPPAPEVSEITFSLLLNLAAACNPENKDILWGFISKYAPDASPETCPMLDQLAGFAVQYYNDFVKPTKQYRAPTPAEHKALEDLKLAIEGAPLDADAEMLQTEVFTVGKANGYENLRDWFKALYEILLGQEQGPRMGSFIALYGRENMTHLIYRAMQGEDLAA